MRRDCRLCQHYENQEPVVFVINGKREYIHCFYCCLLRGVFHYYHPCHSFERKQTGRV